MDARVSVHLSRTTRVARGGARRSGAVERDRRRASAISRQRGPAQIFPRDARGQRRPHILCPGDRARGGTAHPAEKRSRDGARASAGHANAAMLASIIIEPNLWPDATVIEWWSVLLRL